MAARPVAYELVIGDKAYSSWSLRPWLAMRRFGIPFTEVNVPLRVPDRRSGILRHSPSGKVPALKTEGGTIWDSLAILEFLAEAHPDRPWWPRERFARALARSVSAEMHSGFAALRQHLPMDFVSVRPLPEVPQEVEWDLRRLVAIWHDCRARFGGGDGFLFGAFGIADAMYAPVASRLRTYGVDLAAFGDDGTAAAYRDAVLAMPEMAQWGQGARAELAARASERADDHG